jgi:hypothetical protein
VSRREDSGGRNSVCLSRRPPRRRICSVVSGRRQPGAERQSLEPRTTARPQIPTVRGEPNTLQVPVIRARAVERSKKLFDVRPVYPASERARRLHLPHLQITIGEPGSVVDVVASSMRKAPLAPAFEQAATRAVRQRRHEPTLIGGIPVSVKVRAAMTFSCLTPERCTVRTRMCRLGRAPFRMACPRIVGRDQISAFVASMRDVSGIRQDLLRRPCLDSLSNDSPSSLEPT